MQTLEKVQWNKKKCNEEPRYENKGMKTLNQNTFQEIGVSGVDECLTRFSTSKVLILFPTKQKLGYEIAK